MRLSPILILMIFFGLTGTCIGQIADDYIPLTSSGDIPEKFRSFTQDEISSEIVGGDRLSADDLDQLAGKIYYFRKEYMEAGQYYLENDLTKYVRDIVKVILDANPAQKADIKVYVSRAMEVNAFCIADGTIVINVGLLAALDNESELAFILAHEISHYLKQHTVNDLLNQESVKEIDNSYGSSDRSVFRKLAFSRDSEFDADGFAINLLKPTGFDLDASADALLKLRVSDTLVDTDPDLVLLNKYLKSEYSDYDTAWISEETIIRLRRRDLNRADGFITSEDYDDLLNTHPDIEKRQYAVKEIIENLPGADNREVKNSGLTDYNVIKAKAQVELVENSMRESYYIHALYTAIRLLEDYPDNIYLNTTLSKSLYWLSYYKEINSGDLVVEEPTSINDKSYFRVKSIVEKLEISDAKKLSYGNAKILEKQLQSNEVSLFYMALNTEHYLGKNASFSYYNDYLKKYPNGKFTEYVNNRLTYMK